jgi:hypothetical protein
MLADSGYPARRSGVHAVEDKWLRNMPGATPVALVNFAEHAARAEVRVIHDFVETIHRRPGHARLIEQWRPLSARPMPQRFRNAGAKFSFARCAFGVLYLRDIGEAEKLA